MGGIVTQQFALDFPNSVKSIVSIISSFFEAKLIEKLAPNEKKFAIEYNGEIISKGNFPQTFLRDGDKLEIVIAVGGG